MFIIEFNRDTELVLDRPPYGVYFEKGEEIEVTSWKKDMDMIIAQSRDYGELIIFNEDITISEKTAVKP